MLPVMMIYADIRCRLAFFNRLLDIGDSLVQLEITAAVQAAGRFGVQKIADVLVVCCKIKNRRLARN
jgi:hypothetical protein